jgi:hypothetical protein
MKINNLLIYIFAVALLLFAIVSASYWNNVSDNDITLNLIMMLMLELLGICIITLNINKIRMKGIVTISVFWVLLIPVVLILNLSDYLIADIIQVSLWPIVFLSSYLLIKDQSVHLYKLQKKFVFIFLIMLLFFVRTKNSDSETVNSVGDIILSENMIYFPLLTLPWLMLIEKKWIRNFLLFVLFIAVLYSFKRTAILAIVLGFVPYLFLSLKSSKKIVVNIIFLLMTLGVFGFSFYKIDQMENNAIVGRFSSMGEDGGSGRLIIYGIVYELQSQSSSYEWLFGHGHYAVKRDSSWDMSSHNDFLEVLYDYGIIIFHYCPTKI